MNLLSITQKTANLITHNVGITWSPSWANLGNQVEQNIALIFDRGSASYDYSTVRRLNIRDMIPKLQTNYGLDNGMSKYSQGLYFYRLNKFWTTAYTGFSTGGNVFANSMFNTSDLLNYTLIQHGGGFSTDIMRDCASGASRLYWSDGSITDHELNVIQYSSQAQLYEKNPLSMAIDSSENVYRLGMEPYTYPNQNLAHPYLYKNTGKVAVNFIEGLVGQYAQWRAKADALPVRNRSGMVEEQFSLTADYSPFRIGWHQGTTMNGLMVLAYNTLYWLDSSYNVQAMFYVPFTVSQIISWNGYVYLNSKGWIYKCLF